MKSLCRFTVLIAMLFSMSACGGKKFSLAIIGDAFGSNSIPQAYQTAVEEEMGDPANLHTWQKSSQTLASFLEDFRESAELRSAVEEADVILMGVSPRWANAAENLYLNGLCRGDDNQDCLRKATAKAKCDWKSIADILVDLRGGNPVVLHAIVWGDWLYPAYYGNKITPEKITVLASYYNDYQGFMASTPGIRTALVFAESYDKIPPEYIPDGLHLSYVGSAAVADLLRKTGFEPATIGSPDASAMDCASISQ